MKPTTHVPSWEISANFWRKVEPLIPKPKRDPNREYLRKPGAGRKPLPPRQVFAGIVFVLRTGIQWKALPKERFGSPSAIHRYFLEWQADGFFERLWRAGLVEYDALQGIAWAWQSIDGSLTEAPLAQDAVGPNPTERGKNGTKTSLLVDGRGIPLSFVVSGAETPDVTLRPDTLAALVLRWREVGNGWRPTLGGDRGYTGAAAWEASAAAGYRPALQQRGGTTERIPLPAARLHRWVVERCHSWLKRFRKLTIRSEKLKCSYEGLIQLACAMICWRQTLPICG